MKRGRGVWLAAGPGEAGHAGEAGGVDEDGEASEDREVDPEAPEGVAVLRVGGELEGIDGVGEWVDAGEHFEPGRQVVDREEGAGEEEEREEGQVHDQME